MSPPADVLPENRPVRQCLERGIVQILPQAGADLVERHLRYIELLQRWNRTFNLTAIRAPLDMVVRHVLDSLTVHPYVRGDRVLDVGSGAGLPGIPLALASPEHSVVLLDSNGKKIRFLRQVVFELALTNVTVVQARAERFRPALPFDTVIARAFADLPALLRIAWPLLAPAGRVLAMKGREPGAELRRLAGDEVAWRCHRLKVPNLAAERCLIVLEPPATANWSV
ncbi:16S rRNA (guanine(527)-N(7))-methyltransferase RsmG [Nitrococcus mobilis]|uniref:16S rRNA (guanine(527)-N(7))-methyltransferase RsmG n=1 Tax=Nitrococcus mobilis TaxID=35797 RepID=UPI001E4D9FA8|nr:16S rRNA (guanine(527)-N(7))-methyltransferase RsmG [Nitrococcus mobilis]